MGLTGVTYICDGRKVCGGAPGCQKECKHTLDPSHALSKESPELILQLLEKFEIVGDVRLIEKEK